MDQYETTSKEQFGQQTEDWLNTPVGQPSEWEMGTNDDWCDDDCPDDYPTDTAATAASQMGVAVVGCEPIF